MLAVWRLMVMQGWLYAPNFRSIGMAGVDNQSLPLCNKMLPAGHHYDTIPVYRYF